MPTISVNDNYRYLFHSSCARVLASMLCLFFFLPFSASAQTPGQLLWSVDLTYTPETAAPKVAPDGTIYIHSDDLYAITPAGQIIWTKPSSDPKPVDIGLDGTVYSGSGGTVFAYSPAGTLLWTFTEPPGGQGIMAGPTVGPDGNIYVITDGGGLGAFSLTPAGTLRWNVPGYVNFQGTGLTPVPLDGDRLYFAEDVVPGCTAFSEGINSVTFNGQLAWCISHSGISRPKASPNGNAHVHDFGVLYTYTPAGDLAWSFSFPFPSGTLIGPSVGPEGNVYIFHNYQDLWSFTPDGAVRWTAKEVAGSNFPIEPAISPDGKTIVYGTVFSFGVNGAIFAVNAQTGAVLWSSPITGPSAGAAGPASFSADGQVVYVPVTQIGGTNQLLALSVNGGGPSLSVTGACPGSATLKLTGLTPNGTAQIYASKRAGSTTLTGGACSGTVLGLSRARLFGSKTADANGVVTLPRNLNGNSCGAFVQGIDITSCGVSNITNLP
ncbi:MAG TPA: PQQ-binding-like beta-propeller repeat protein [Terriglobales bacterium]|nr:PQQ-binding-like beta-propeller repeat protein [Terriglobales bacterium]